MLTDSQDRFSEIFNQLSENDSESPFQCIHIFKNRELQKEELIVKNCDIEVPESFAFSKEFQIATVMRNFGPITIFDPATYSERKQIRPQNLKTYNYGNKLRLFELRWIPIKVTITRHFVL